MSNNNNVLDDILGEMEPPPKPKMTDEQRQRRSAQLERTRKYKLVQKEKLLAFRKDIEQQVQVFLSTDRNSLELDPVEKILRSIIYDVAEVAGLTSYAYGEDDDRYVVIYRNHDGPSQDEKTVRNSGRKWDSSVAAAMAAEREESKQSASTASFSGNADKPTASKFAPSGTYYGDKYKHLSLQPQRTTSNSLYGEVPSLLKRDHRSIEQALNDIMGKRKTKVAKVSSTTMLDEDFSSDSDSD